MGMSYYSDKMEARDLSWGKEKNTGLRLLLRKRPAARNLWEIAYSVTFTY